MGLRKRLRRDPIVAPAHTTKMIATKYHKGLRAYWPASEKVRVSTVFPWGSSVGFEYEVVTRLNNPKKTSIPSKI